MYTTQLNCAELNACFRIELSAKIQPCKLYAKAHDNSIVYLFISYVLVVEYIRNGFYKILHV